MATKLTLYNGALRLIGERAIASLTESRESRRVLDESYSPAMAYCLEQGQWNFAIRAIEALPSTSIVPAFGYANAFTKPSDWIRTTALCSDEYFREPLLRYNDETGYWYADDEIIYVRYVSNDPEYGMDLARWPTSYTKYVETYLAADVCERLTQNATKVAQIRKDLKTAATEAKSRDAMNDASVMFPEGSWARSRRGSYGGSRYDRSGWNA